MPAASAYIYRNGLLVPLAGGVPIAPGGTGGGGSTPTPGGTGMLVGESRNNGNTALFDAMAAQAGPYTVARAYQSGQWRSTWAADVGGPDVGKRATVYSCKPDMTQMASGALDSSLKAFVASIPDSHICFLAMWHEPDVKFRKGTLLIPAWLAAMQRFADVITAVGKPHVYVSIILSNWSYVGAGEGNGSPDQFWQPGFAGKVDNFGVDFYLTSNTPTSGAHEQDPGIAFADLHGLSYGIAEIGLLTSVSNLTVGATWMQTHADYASTNGGAGPHKSCAYLCWFDQNVGSPTNGSLLVPSASPTLITAAKAISGEYLTPYTTFVN